MNNEKVFFFSVTLLLLNGQIKLPSTPNLCSLMMFSGFNDVRKRPHAQTGGASLFLRGYWGECPAAWLPGGTWLWTLLGIFLMGIEWQALSRQLILSKNLLSPFLTLIPGGRGKIFASTEGPEPIVDHASPRSPCLGVWCTLIWGTVLFWMCEITKPTQKPEVFYSSVSVKCSLIKSCDWNKHALLH